MLRYGARCDLLNTPGRFPRVVTANVAVLVDNLARTPFCGLRICFHDRFHRAAVESSLVIEYSLDVRGQWSDTSYVGPRAAITCWDCKNLSRRRTKGFCSVSATIVLRVEACFSKALVKGVTAVSGCHVVQYGSVS